MTIIENPVNTPAAWSARAEAERTPWGAAGWSRSGQRDRFAEVLDALKPKAGETLLDFGCGTGALADMLPREIGYVGYDSAPGMVTRAAREHPGRHFQTWEPLGTADLVACIGPFNLADGWSKERTWQTLRRLWDGCGRAMAACLYAGTDPSCLSYGVEETWKQISGLSWRVNVNLGRPNDLLVVIQR